MFDCFMIGFILVGRQMEKASMIKSNNLLYVNMSYSTK